MRAQKGSIEFSQPDEVDAVFIEFGIDPPDNPHHDPEIRLINIEDIEDYISRNIKKWIKKEICETWSEDLPLPKPITARITRLSCPESWEVA